MRNEQFSQREKLEKKDWIQRQAEQMPRLDFWRKEGPVSFLRSAGCSSRYTEVASDGTMNPRSRLSQFVAAPRYFFWIPSARQQAIKMRVKVKKWIIAQHQFCNWFLLFIFFVLSLTLGWYSLWRDYFVVGRMTHKLAWNLLWPIAICIFRSYENLALLSL